MFKWRVRPVWWLVALAPLVLYTLLAIVLRFIQGQWPDLAALGQIDFLPNLGGGALLVWFLTFGLGEETGWRGFALPRLQKGRSALAATAILWILWALWHLPLFFYLYDATILVGFLLGLLSGAIVFTWLYNSSGGSVLLVAVWHAAFNFVGGAVIYSQHEIAELAFSVLGKPPKITNIPAALARVGIGAMRLFDRHAANLFDFFATAGRYDNVAPCFGTHTLDAYFRKLSRAPAEG
jgi:membrane protease YdiL (CAAX protease family)